MSASELSREGEGCDYDGFRLIDLSAPHCLELSCKLTASNACHVSAPPQLASRLVSSRRETECLLDRIQKNISDSKSNESTILCLGGEEMELKCLTLLALVEIFFSDSSEILMIQLFWQIEFLALIRFYPRARSLCSLLFQQIRFCDNFFDSARPSKIPPKSCELISAQLILFIAFRCGRKRGKFH
jgi:hypothetical protein